MVATAEPKLTAAQAILVAAADLAAAGNHEFTEWDLTVAAWSRDRFRFGLRGYAQSYPDHKRVMMEIMGHKPANPVVQKFLEKVRPNTYRLTPLGKATAARLRAEGNRPEFRRWQDNPEEPRDWTGAAAFLGLTQKRGDPAERLDEVKTAVKAALDWCNVQEAVYLTRGAGQGGTPIHVRDLAELLDFLQALVYRFPAALEKPGRKKRD
jgi:hypothetical protein